MVSITAWHDNVSAQVLLRSLVPENGYSRASERRGSQQLTSRKTQEGHSARRSKDVRENHCMSVKEVVWDSEVGDTPQEAEECPPKFTSTYKWGGVAS